ncbi:MAG: leucine-rich repeat domain-containing protein, partial [Mycoplasmataceae bacterium]|nr:leucine-rich repeat domain-containing protein [Mycoplasmataceae bacterium]
AMFASNNTAVIERYAFSNCTALHEIYIPAEVAADLTNGESYAFNNCSASGTIWYPIGKESIATNFKSKFTGLQNWTPSPIS